MLNAQTRLLARRIKSQFRKDTDAWRSQGTAIPGSPVLAATLRQRW